MEKQGFESWAIVELMGHMRIAGKVSEAEIGGGKLLRVDVPEIGGKQALTKFFGAAAVYALTPVDEETARLAARDCGGVPVNEWSARKLLESADAAKALNAPPTAADDDEDDSDSEDDLNF